MLIVTNLFAIVDHELAQLEQQMHESTKEAQTLSVIQAGVRLGLGRGAAYRAAKRGEIPVLRFGRNIRVPVAALERLLQGERLQRSKAVDDAE